MPSKYELPRGASVGKYEILRKIATGGMAELYLARARGTAGFEKLVVLKRILPQVAADPEFVQMFLDEARLSSTLQHPNIADVYDVGEVDGQYFFTMEFVHGQDLRTIRHEMKQRSEPIPLAATLAIVHGAASALDYAHERRGPDGTLLGVVHRDVSASNIMVSYDGAVKLVDFGIARVRSTTHKTQIGTLKGKIPYMSPEQCKGLAIDRRSDLFSLGVVLFEMTVGRRPFRGDSDFAIMDQIVHQGAPTPSSLMAGYPAALEAIVMKCLQRDPKARYTTCDELAEDLEAFTQQFGLWISPKQLGKYMRTVFADRIKAWEDAEKAGVPFIQHVTESITSQSQQSNELLTPPSAFPALPARTSQQSSEVLASLRPTPPSMQAAEQPTSIDALHQKLGQPSVPPRPPTRQILAVTLESLAKGVPRPPELPHNPPAQLPLQTPDKSGDGWEAPTTSQPEEELARALAADPDAGAAFRAPALAERDRDAASRLGFKSERAPAPLPLPPPRPAAPPASRIHDEQLTQKPIHIAPAFVRDPAAVQAPAPALQSAPVPSVKPSSKKLLLIVLVVVLVLGAAIGGFLLAAGSGDDKPAASVDQGSEVHATSTPIEIPPPSPPPPPAAGSATP